MAGGNARVVKPLLKKVNFEVIEKILINYSITQQSTWKQ